VIYFILVVVVVSYVLMNLFAAIVIYGMEMALHDVKQESHLMDQVQNFVMVFSLKRETISAYVELFSILLNTGKDDRDSISLDETLAIIRLLTNVEVPLEKLKDIIEDIDPDSSGDINLSEFLLIITVMRRHTVNPIVQRYVSDVKYRSKTNYERSLLPENHFAQKHKYPTEEDRMLEDTYLYLTKLRRRQRQQARHFVRSIRDVEHWRDDLDQVRNM